MKGQAILEDSCLVRLLNTELVQIEGKVFKLSLEKDRETNLHRYCDLSKSIERQMVRHTQLRTFLDEFNKQKELQKIVKANEAKQRKERFNELF